MSPEFAEEIDEDLAADAAESLQILRDPTGDLEKEEDEEGGIPLDPADEGNYSRITTQKIRALGPRPEKP